MSEGVSLGSVGTYDDDWLASRPYRIHQPVHISAVLRRLIPEWNEKR